MHSDDSSDFQRFSNTGYKGCCNTCKNECNTKHDCQLNFDNDDCSWWNAVLTVFDYDEVIEKQPEKLKEYIKKLIKEY